MGKSANCCAAVVVVLGIVAGQKVVAEPPSDVEIFHHILRIQDRYVTAEQKNFHEAKRSFRAFINEEAAGIQIDELTPYQLSLIGPLLVTGELDADTKSALSSALQRASDDRTHGAAALLLLHTLNYPDLSYLARFFRRPDMEAAMNSNYFGVRALNAFALDPSLMQMHVRDIKRAVLSIRSESWMHAPGRPIVARLLDALNHPDIAAKMRAHRDAIHGHLLKVARSVMSTYTPVGGASYVNDEYYFRSARDLVEYLEGPAARLALVGQPAPELHFDWSRGPQAPFDELSDLQGKIVVLDFWATWCGPCVASFPELRRLQERYAQSDVVLIGVTSIQGNHVPIGRAPVLTKDQPERELELMSGYIDENDVTWNIAFSSRSVIDPRYDVWGVPHVTVVDANGTVRHNGTDKTSFEDKVKLIDALLEEAGLDVPPELAAK